MLVHFNFIISSTVQKTPKIQTMKLFLCQSRINKIMRANIIEFHVREKCSRQD